MYDSEWFQGRSVDEHEVAYWGRVITEIACAVIAGIILGGISGCATKEEAQLQYCFLEYVGETDGGLSVVKSICLSPEAFAESQK